MFYQWSLVKQGAPQATGPIGPTFGWFVGRTDEAMSKGLPAPSRPRHRARPRIRLSFEPATQHSSKTVDRNEVLITGQPSRRSRANRGGSSRHLRKRGDDDESSGTADPAHSPPTGNLGKRDACMARARRINANGSQPGPEASVVAIGTLYLVRIDVRNPTGSLSTMALVKAQCTAGDDVCGAAVCDQYIGTSPAPRPGSASGLAVERPGQLGGERAESLTPVDAGQLVEQQRRDSGLGSGQDGRRRGRRGRFTKLRPQCGGVVVTVQRVAGPVAGRCAGSRRHHPFRQGCARRSMLRAVVSPTDGVVSPTIGMSTCVRVGVDVAAPSLGWRGLDLDRATDDVAADHQPSRRASAGSVDTHPCHSLPTSPSGQHRRRLCQWHVLVY